MTSQLWEKNLHTFFHRKNGHGRNFQEEIFRKKFFEKKNFSHRNSASAGHRQCRHHYANRTTAWWPYSWAYWCRPVPGLHRWNRSSRRPHRNSQRHTCPKLNKKDSRQEEDFVIKKKDSCQEENSLSRKNIYDRKKIFDKRKNSWS